MAKRVFIISFLAGLVLLKANIQAAPVMKKEQLAEVAVKVSALTISQTKETSSGTITSESSSGSASADQDYSEEKKSWDFYQSFPLVKISIYYNGLAFHVRPAMFLSEFFGGYDAWLGYRFSPAFEVGLYGVTNYSGETSESKTGDNESQKSDTLEQALNLGPYVKSRLGSARFFTEIEGILLKTSSFSHSKYNDSEDKGSGMGLGIAMDLGFGLAENLEYSFGLNIRYSSEQKEEKKDSGSGVSTSKFTRKSLNYEITLVNFTAKI